MNADSKSMVMNSALYREFLAEREEILKHKWIEADSQGRTSDRYGAEMVMTYAMLGWSGVTVITPLVTRSLQAWS